MTAIDCAAGTVLRGPLVTAILVCGLCWMFVLNGAGTGMNVWSMTTWRFPPGSGQSFMQANWTLSYSASMLGMWWTMMLAMMLPGVIAEVLRGSIDGSFSLRFLGMYALVWFAVSVPATALQSAFEHVGWVDGMRMWSTDPGFSRVFLALAAATQIWRLARPQTFPDCVPGQSRRSGLAYGRACVLATGPMMALLYVGGIMNMIWIFALGAWALARKIWPRSRALPAGSAIICLALLFLA